VAFLNDQDVISHYFYQDGGKSMGYFYAVAAAYP
jgi:hypothetical protein